MDPRAGDEADDSIAESWAYQQASMSRVENSSSKNIPAGITLSGLTISWKKGIFWPRTRAENWKRKSLYCLPFVESSVVRCKLARVWGGSTVYGAAVWGTVFNSKWRFACLYIVYHKASYLQTEGIFARVSYLSDLVDQPPRWLLKIATRPDSQHDGCWPVHVQPARWPWTSPPNRWLDRQSVAQHVMFWG